MAISKIVYKSSESATPVTWMDATPATAAAADILAPKTAMLANGVVTTGTGTGGGGSTKARKDVNFYDYDGTIVESYTTAEFADISALPDNPTHTGLTAQGWNMPSDWTLANAKTYISTNKKADWGQMYTTSSGATEIDVEFTDPNRLSPNMSLAVNGTVSVDWGDGSSATTVTGTSLSTRKNTGTHTYPAVGKYTIKVTASSGSWGFYGTSNNPLLYKTNSINPNRVYANCVKNVRIGSGCTAIGQYAFLYCCSLANITIPNTVTSLGGNSFQYCYALASITIPIGITSIIGSTFQYCASLVNIMIPNSVTSIEASAFQYCTALWAITIPNSVTSIGASAFYNDYALDNITLPNSITSIGGSAFYGCHGLGSIVLPSNITSIGTSEFQNCYSLSGITIPSSVTSIASKAFSSCYGLGSIHLKPTTPPSVAASDAFSNVPTDCKIYVPTGKLSTYTGTSNYPSSSTYTYIEE